MRFAFCVLAKENIAIDAEELEGCLAAILTENTIQE